MKTHVSKLNPSLRHISRGLCLGGAGASLAVLLVTAQLFSTSIDPKGEQLSLILCFASGALPFWLALWLFCEPENYFEETAEYLQLDPIWKNVAILLFGGGAGGLGSSIYFLIVLLAEPISHIFFGIVVFLFAIVFLFLRSLEKSGSKGQKSLCKEIGGAGNRRPRHILGKLGKRQKT